MTRTRLTARQLVLLEEALRAYTPTGHQHTIDEFKHMLALVINARTINITCDRVLA